MTPDKALRKLQGTYAKKLDALGSKLSREEITEKEFISLGRNLIAEAHSRADWLGETKAGVKKAFNPTDKRAGSRIPQEELSFLRGFKRDLASGAYKPARQGGKGAQARKARAALYAKKLTGTANAAWARSKPDDRTRWRLGPAEHCQDCLDESEKDWRPLSDFDRFPGDGSTECITNCRCSLETENGEEGFSND